MLKKLLLYTAISFGLIAVVLTTASFNTNSPNAESITVSKSNGSAIAQVHAPQFHIPPLAVESISPAQGAINVSLNPTITVQFSAPLASLTPMPWLSPMILGSWSQVSPDEVVFTPQQSFQPYTTVTLTIPGGPGGMEGAASQLLQKTQITTFTTTSGPTIQLQQDLALLGYLPLTYNTTTGAFAWQYANIPAGLQALWQPGVYNEMTKAAVMSFEYFNGLSVDGVAGQQVWISLADDVAANKTNPFGYSFVSVSKALPETVQVWHNGQIAFSTLANTGIAAAPTPDGTFAVYLRYVSTTMKGVNPNGTPYNDPNIPWVSYFNGGDALHGFIRASYGFPQSVGCVEMPFSSAQTVFNLTTYGTLVSIY